jgi:hypothetical protein
MKPYPLLIFLWFLPFLNISPQGGQSVSSQSQHVARGGRIAYSMIPVRRTGIRFPRLVRLENKEVLRLVNRQIDALTSEFGCSDRGADSYYKVRSRVDFAGKGIFSIYASAEYYCGGPYPPNDSNISVTFDLKTGKQVKFEELFRDYETDKRAILRAMFAKQVENSEKLMATGRKNEDTCEGNPGLYSLDRLQDSTFSFNFSRQGLKVQPQWPHVVEACAELVTVPYSRLSKYAAPNGLLSRMGK